MKRIVEGFIVFTLIPVMFILAIMEWIDNAIFGECNDYER